MTRLSQGVGLATLTYHCLPCESSAGSPTATTLRLYIPACCFATTVPCTLSLCSVDVKHKKDTLRSKKILPRVENSFDVVGQALHDIC
jgi:hypothetical protein